MSADFADVFNKTLDQIEADANEVGLSLSALCRETKIGRATPDRWRRMPPKTIRLIKQMQEMIAARRREMAEQAKATA